MRRILLGAAEISFVKQPPSSQRRILECEPAEDRLHRNGYDAVVV